VTRSQGETRVVAKTIEDSQAAFRCFSQVNDEDS
jgi:hypothetical protein